MPLGAKVTSVRAARGGGAGLCTPGQLDLNHAATVTSNAVCNRAYQSVIHHLKLTYIVPGLVKQTPADRSQAVGLTASIHTQIIGLTQPCA